MKTTKYIYGITAFIGLLLAASSCSDNLDDKLEPVSTDKFINVIINDRFSSELDIASNASTTLIEINSNLEWAVTVDGCEGGWCKVNVTNHRGNGTFDITVDENGLQARECNVTVSSINYTKEIKSEIHVVQQPVSQENAKPTVGNPELIEGVGQTSASIQFSCSSPYYPLLGYGIQYKKEKEEEWKNASGNLNNGIVKIDLTGLTFGTTYEARAYVEYDVNGNKNIQHSSGILTFITDGETPEGGDNPPPPVPTSSM